jgi:hypothetical protein
MTFRKGLAPFTENARKAGPGQRRRPARTSASRQRSGDIRAWAKAQGIPVSDRGRIPASVAGQYEAASSVAGKRYRYRGSKIPTPWIPEPAAASSS